MTVFVMNLLIAKMASRYDVIERRFQEYRHFQHIALIKRYKDGGLPPPFNLISLLTSGVRKIMLRCGASDEKMDRPAALYRVLRTGRNVSRRVSSARTSATFFERRRRSGPRGARDDFEKTYRRASPCCAIVHRAFDQIEGSLRMTSHRSKSFDSQSTWTSPKHRSDASVGKAVKFRTPRDPIYLSSFLSDGDCGQVVKMESSRRPSAMKVSAMSVLIGSVGLA